jgi:hypothetical protein
LLDDAGQLPYIQFAKSEPYAFRFDDVGRPLLNQFSLGFGAGDYYGRVRLLEEQLNSLSVNLTRKIACVSRRSGMNSNDRAAAKRGWNSRIYFRSFVILQKQVWL